MAPLTAPHVLPVIPMPAPKGALILQAVLSGILKRDEKAIKMDWEQL